VARSVRAESMLGSRAVSSDEIAKVEPVTARRGFGWVGVERAAHAVGTVPRGPMFMRWEAPIVTPGDAHTQRPGANRDGPALRATPLGTRAPV
jgi:hypothetical protein